MLSRPLYSLLYSLGRHDGRTQPCCAVQAELEAEKTLALNSHKTADRLKRELEIAVTDKLRAQEEVRCNHGSICHLT